MSKRASTAPRSLDSAHAVVRGVFMYGVIAVQSVIGVVLFVMALARAGRPLTGDAATVPTAAAEPAIGLPSPAVDPGA